MSEATSELFNVVQFFVDGSYEYVRRHVDAKTAVQAADHYCNNVASQMGVTTRVIITDGGDSICFEWIAGKGVTFK